MSDTWLKVGLFSILIWAVAGCGQTSGQGPVIPGNQTIQNANESGRRIWGIYEIVLDRESSERAQLVEQRAGSDHLNIRTFLEDSPCKDCIKITNAIGTPVGMELTVSITHPFPKLLQFTGFDVRGTIFADGSIVFPQFDILASSPLVGDACVLNADGFTTLFNPTEYNGDGLLGYSRGKLLPPSMPDPNGTLGAFKAFYSDGQSEEDGGRRAFFPGDTVERTYEIALPQGKPLRIGYVIDSCWAAADISPPSELDDFPESANCPEPFRLDVDCVENQLFTDCGYVRLEVTVFDHQGVVDLDRCSLEAPGLSSMLYIDDTPQQLGPDTALYEFEVTNDLGGADPVGEEMVFRVDHGGIDPNLGPVPAWAFYVAHVSAPSGKPGLDSIVPNQGFQSGNVQTAISGAGFKPGATVEIYQGITVIKGTNVQVESSCRMTADFSLTGPPGTYTVFVENPGGQWGELKDGFTIL
jgi:hypothetical protein